MFSPYPHQKEKSEKGAKILRELKIVYLAMDTRTGKTITSFEICRKCGFKSVLMFTTKESRSSIRDDYELGGYTFELLLINDESMHKVEGDFDVVIHDEHHRMGAFPDPPKRAITFKKRWGDLPHIYLSGTPTAETWTRIYHQFWVSNHSPFKQWPKFHRARPKQSGWAYNFVDIKLNHTVGGRPSNDYTQARVDKMMDYLEPYMIRCTKAEAGINCDVIEHIHTVNMSSKVHAILDELQRNRVSVSTKDRERVIKADTGGKAYSKYHQLSSGTVKLEPVGDEKTGKSVVVDESKAIYLKEHFNDKKIAIFYIFTAELAILKSVFGARITKDKDEFNRTGEEKWLALQIVSGREGTNLSKADDLVMFNISASEISYFQAKDRMTIRERDEAHVHWLFSNTGFEEKVYNAVSNKASYTKKMFEKHFGFKTRKARRSKGLSAA